VADQRLLDLDDDDHAGFRRHHVRIRCRPHLLGRRTARRVHVPAGDVAVRVHPVRVHAVDGRTRSATCAARAAGVDVGTSAAHPTRTGRGSAHRASGSGRRALRPDPRRRRGSGSHPRRGSQRDGWSARRPRDLPQRARRPGGARDRHPVRPDQHQHRVHRARDRAGRRDPGQRELAGLGRHPRDRRRRPHRAARRDPRRGDGGSNVRTLGQ
jgi:hypothetical protein